MTDHLLSQTCDGVLWVAFNRPDARNALTFAMYEGLAEVCAAVPTDGSIKAVVVSGAGGKAFAAGTDMSQFRDFKCAADAIGYEKRIDAVLTAIEGCGVPTIAAINGACTGGGAAIAAACDLRLATDNLKFGFPIARTLGNCLSAKSLRRLTALMGEGRVREMIFTARLVGADEAHSIGLIGEVLPDEPALMTRTAALAELLGGMAPLTLRATKEALRRNRAEFAPNDDDLIEMCYMSQDFRNGMDAFLNKRKPEWTGT